MSLLCTLCRVKPLAVAPATSPPLNRHSSQCPCPASVKRQSPAVTAPKRARGRPASPRPKRAPPSVSAKTGRLTLRGLTWRLRKECNGPGQINSNRVSVPRRWRRIGAYSGSLALLLAKRDRTVNQQLPPAAQLAATSIEGFTRPAQAIPKSETLNCLCNKGCFGAR
jgi:hypothetical protein